MNAFIHKYSAHVTGFLSGFDRLVFRGTLRALSFAAGMMTFLWRMQVLLKDFGAYAEGVTERLKEASLQEARRLSRPVRYLPACRQTGRRVRPARKRWRARSPGPTGSPKGGSPS